MLRFDYRGYLTPNTNIVSDLVEMTAAFVHNIKSEQRKVIFDKYLLYSDGLKAICDQEYIQWVNGSFCTLKSEPKDIDIVSFIPYFIIDANESVFSEFSYPFSEARFGVDAYIVKIYPENSRYYPHYVADRLYWLNMFSKTKVNRAGRQYSKGFLEISY